LVILIILGEEYNLWSSSLFSMYVYIYDNISNYRRERMLWSLQK
jgi:hypothetical protein